MAFDQPRSTDTPAETTVDPRARLLAALGAACRDLGIEAKVVAGGEPIAPVLVVERLSLVKEIIVDRQLVGPETNPLTGWVCACVGEQVGSCDNPTSAARLVAAMLGQRVRM